MNSTIYATLILDMITFDFVGMALADDFPPDEFNDLDLH